MAISEAFRCSFMPPDLKTTGLLHVVVQKMVLHTLEKVRNSKSISKVVFRIFTGPENVQFYASRPKYTIFFGSYCISMVYGPQIHTLKLSEFKKVIFKVVLGPENHFFACSFMPPAQNTQFSWVVFVSPWCMDHKYTLSNCQNSKKSF